MRQPRILDPDQIYFVTNRTLHGRAFLAPSDGLNNLVGGILAYAVRKFGVELFAFVIMSNHFHMIVKGKPGVIPNFVGFFSSLVARKVGRRIDWSGKFWHRRYSCEPILDDSALLGRVQYIFSHGVKEGLVNRAEDWPGLNSIPELVRGEERQFPWYSETTKRRVRASGQDCDESMFVEKVTLRLQPLPLWSDLPPKRRRRLFSALLENAEHQSRKGREGKPALGVLAIVTQNPSAKPRESKQGIAPLFHASSKAIGAAFLSSWRALVAIYREASLCWRRGLQAQFPPNSFRPSVGEWCLR